MDIWENYFSELKLDPDLLDQDFRDTITWKTCDIEKFYQGLCNLKDEV